MLDTEPAVCPPPKARYNSLPFIFYLDYIWVCNILTDNIIIWNSDGCDILFWIWLQFQ